MDVMQAIGTRRSIRKYQTRPVSDQLINSLLEAARWAPTPANLQFRQFVVVQNTDLIGRIAAATLNQPYVAEPPVVIAVCTNLRAAGDALSQKGLPLATQEAAASVQNMLLAAQSAGLATCWVGLFDVQQVDALLNLPTGVTTLALVCIGYAGETPETPTRKPITEIARWLK